ncbi:MAG TPA: MlaD family protein [Tepidisphaeraceae bacterium]|jgi:ABC-type transporter Mla subunit MlaD|nr:MlaD family protein [Tepidisphaeraceae bacterium]
MKNDRNALKAGSFIVISFVVAITIVLLIRGQGMAPSQERSATFKLTDDLGGLGVGDDVRIGGVKVGSVSAVQLTALDSPAPKVLVKFTFPGSYVLREDAHVAVQSAITGPANLNITNLGAGKPLADGVALVGAPDPKSELLASLGRTAPHLEAIATVIETQTIPKVNETVGSFKQSADSATTLVHHVNDKIDPAVEKYDGVTQRAGEALVQVRDLVGDSKTDFRGTVKNLNEATASIRDKLPGLLERVTAVIDKVNGAMVSARAALEDVQKTAANARDLTAGARSVIVDNHGKLDSIITGLKSTSDNLKATSIEVRRSPWRLLYKPEANEMANLNLYDTTRQFSEGAGSLSDAATALRDALHDPNVNKAQLEKLMQQLDESFSNFHKVEDKLWTSVKQ